MILPLLASICQRILPVGLVRANFWPEDFGLVAACCEESLVFRSSAVGFMRDLGGRNPDRASKICLGHLEEQHLLAAEAELQKFAHCQLWRKKISSGKFQINSYSYDFY